jgi:hypothetical protein
MIENKSKVISICFYCGYAKFAGEDCAGCATEKKFRIEKYAGALKTAVKCWQDADCNEHQAPCHAALKEFADKILELQNRIEILENGIIKHRDKKQNKDDADKDLWKLI